MQVLWQQIAGEKNDYCYSVFYKSSINNYKNIDAFLEFLDNLPVAECRDEKIFFEIRVKKFKFALEKYHPEHINDLIKTYEGDIFDVYTVNPNDVERERVINYFRKRKVLSFDIKTSGISEFIGIYSDHLIIKNPSLLDYRGAQTKCKDWFFSNCVRGWLTKDGNIYIWVPINDNIDYLEHRHMKYELERILKYKLLTPNDLPDGTAQVPETHLNTPLIFDGSFVIIQLYKPSLLEEIVNSNENVLRIIDNS